MKSNGEVIQAFLNQKKARSRSITSTGEELLDYGYYPLARWVDGRSIVVNRYHYPSVTSCIHHSSVLSYLWGQGYRPIEFLEEGSPWEPKEVLWRRSWVSLESRGVTQRIGYQPGLGTFSVTRWVSPYSADVDYWEAQLHRPGQPEVRWKVRLLSSEERAIYEGRSCDRLLQRLVRSYRGHLGAQKAQELWGKVFAAIRALLDLAPGTYGPFTLHPDRSLYFQDPAGNWHRLCPWLPGRPVKLQTIIQAYEALEPAEIMAGLLIGSAESG